MRYKKTNRTKLCRAPKGFIQVNDGKRFNHIKTCTLTGTFKIFIAAGVDPGRWRTQDFTIGGVSVTSHHDDVKYYVILRHWQCQFRFLTFKTIFYQTERL